MYVIDTEIEIEATPATVWQALTDFQSYPDWNPSIRSIEGIPSRGEKLKVFFNPESSIFRMRFTVELVTCEPEKEFRWIGRLLFAPLFAGDHYLIIEPIGPNRSKLIHGERFSGLLKPIVWFLLAKLNTMAFTAMNHALKDYVETRLESTTDRPEPAVEITPG